MCNPADKDGDDPSAVTDPDHYVCYKAKPAAMVALPTVRTNNLNFGANTLAAKKELELCIPAFKDSVPSTTTTTMGACGGGPFNCGGSCAPGGVCAPISDFPPYCGCVPDGSQPCGDAFWPYCNGLCPPGETCGSVAHLPDAGCFCVATQPACGEAAYPTCDGACPSGQACYPFQLPGSSYEFCACTPVGPCGTTCPGLTGGECPPGDVCQVGFDPCGCTPD